MRQRRMNNRTNLSAQGIKCLEGMSNVHTSGIETFNTNCEISRLTFVRTSRIHCCKGFQRKNTTRRAGDFF